jgi:hypothetical protein
VYFSGSAGSFGKPIVAKLRKKYSAFTEPQVLSPHAQGTAADPCPELEASCRNLLPL